MIKKLRVFYRKLNSEIVWTSTVEGEGNFPQTIEEELSGIPSILIGGTLQSDGMPVGGESKDYACIEITDEEQVISFMKSDNNIITKGRLVIGEPRPVVKPEPARDLVKELDDLKMQVTNNTDNISTIAESTAIEIKPLPIKQGG